MKLLIIMLCATVAPIAASAASRVPYLPGGWSMVSANPETKTRGFQSADGRSRLSTGQTPTTGDLNGDMDRIARHDGERITYQRRGKSWIAVSGYRGDQIFYRKSNIACGGTRWHNIEFTYPATDKRSMDQAVTTMARVMSRYSNDC